MKDFPIIVDLLNTCPVKRPGKIVHDSHPMVKPFNGTYG